MLGQRKDTEEHKPLGLRISDRFQNTSSGPGLPGPPIIRSLGSQMYDTVTVRIRHPEIAKEWNWVAGNFKLPTFPHYYEPGIFKLLLPEYEGAMDHLPGYSAIGLLKTLYVHCYCHPDNFWLEGEQSGLWRLFSFANDEEPRKSFLNLYEVCEELRIGCPKDIHNIRHRAVHRLDRNKNYNILPTVEEYAKAILVLRKCIHGSEKNYKVPFVNLYCSSCNKAV